MYSPARNYEEQKAWIDQLLEKLAGVPLEDSGAQAPIVNEMLRAVVELKIVAVSNSATDSADDLSALWRRVGVALAARTPALARSSGRMELAFWRKRCDDWFEACVLRSALQILLTDIEPLVGRFVNDNELVDIDNEISAMANKAVPLPTAALPAGLPDDHWWWRLRCPGEDDADDYDY